MVHITLSADAWIFCRWFAITTLVHVGTMAVHALYAGLTTSLIVAWIFVSMVSVEIVYRAMNELSWYWYNRLGREAKLEIDSLRYSLRSLTRFERMQNRIRPALQGINGSIDEIKEKLTDQEYKQIVEGIQGVYNMV